MRSSEKQELKKKIQRVGWFLLIVFLPLLVVAVCLQVAGISEWINVLVCTIVLFLMFFVFLYVCKKLDERKQARMDKKKDPFSD